MIVFTNPTVTNPGKTMQQQPEENPLPPPPTFQRISATIGSRSRNTNNNNNPYDDENDVVRDDLSARSTPANTRIRDIAAEEEGERKDDHENQQRVLSTIPETTSVQRQNSKSPIPTLPTKIVPSLTVNTTRSSSSTAAPVPSNKEASSVFHRAHSLPVLSVSSVGSIGNSSTGPRSQPQQQHPSRIPARPLECDYDQSPTPLYLAIEAKQWNVVLEMLENDALNDDDDYRRPNSTNSHQRSRRGGALYPMSPRQQAKCWVVRKETDGRLRWRLLPVHAAIIFDADHTVIEALLEAYPASASQKDDQGMLPLHLAFRNITLLKDTSSVKSNNLATAANNILSLSMDADEATLSSSSPSSSTAVNWLIVEELLTAYPQAIFSRDRKGRTPIQGGLFAAQQALKNENKKQKRSSTPNQRKMAALKVVELYAQIAAAGEKNVWLRNHQQKTNQSLAALSEQHAYRLQEFQTEFLLEQQQTNDRYQKEIGNLQQQIETLQQTNASLQNELVSFQQKHQLEQSNFAIVDLQQQHEKDEMMMKQLHKENENLKKQLENLLGTCRSTATALLHAATNHEQMLQSAKSCTITTSSAKKESETLMTIDGTIQQEKLIQQEDLKWCKEENQGDHDTASTQQYEEKEHRLDDQTNTSSGETNAVTETSSLPKPPLHTQVIEEIIVFSDESYGIPTSLVKITTSPPLTEPHVNNNDDPADSKKDEEDAEESDAVVGIRKKQLDHCVPIMQNSTSTSRQSFSFEELKNEILGSFNGMSIVKEKSNDGNDELISPLHSKRTYRSRSLPVMTIRSDDEYDMSTMAPPPSPCAGMKLIPKSTRSFSGVSCSADAFFTTIASSLQKSESVDDSNCSYVKRMSNGRDVSFDNEQASDKAVLPAMSQLKLKANQAFNCPPSSSVLSSSQSPRGIQRTSKSVSSSSSSLHDNSCSSGKCNNSSNNASTGTASNSIRSLFDYEEDE